MDASTNAGGDGKTRGLFPAVPTYGSIGTSDLVLAAQMGASLIGHGEIWDNGLADTFLKAGVQLIHPGCGACIGCGPGVSETEGEVTVSAINRNYKGRSGPGKLWLASPLTVAASAFTGRITAYRPGMFQEMKARELVPA